MNLWPILFFIYICSLKSSNPLFQWVSFLAGSIEVPLISHFSFFIFHTFLSFYQGGESGRHQGLSLVMYMCSTFQLLAVLRVLPSVVGG